MAFAEVEEIDRLNIYWAGLLAMRRAIAALAPAAEHVLIDGRRLRGWPFPSSAIVDGDAKSLSIAAASILAKTARDARMRELDDAYPGYGFAQHKGYPVHAHVAALASWAPAPSTAARSRRCARRWDCPRCRPGPSPTTRAPSREQ